MISIELLKLRGDRVLLLGQVAPYIDTGYLCKMEKRIEVVRKYIIIKLSEIDKTNISKLLSKRLTDKILSLVENETNAENVILIAQDKYQLNRKHENRN